MPPFSRQPASRSAPPKVALLIETSNAYARGLLGGIEKYLRSEGPWDVYLTEHGRGELDEWISRWRGDGILARIENEAIAAALKSVQIPVVDLSSFRLLPGAPTITTDNARIAAAAFEHFWERGFKHFGYCGVERFAWSRERATHFEALVKKHGTVCSVYPEQGADGDAETDQIAAWLARLPKPAAIFSAYDARGQQVLAACRRRDFSVPEEIAVLGVDNDEVMCELSPPPLSSVIPDTERTGRLAAEVLARMMAGTRVAAVEHRIPPLGVQTRQSTDTLAVEDPRLAAALRYIRQNATGGLKVKEVLARHPMARRSLEKQMRAAIGRTPQQEIRRVQVERARHLLRGTKLTLADIAERCGFRHPEYLTVSFKRETGVSPSEYRRQSTAPGDASTFSH